MPDSSDNKPLSEGIDFYMEGPYMVFTAEYLRGRGYCCESGCRHCPWGFDRKKLSDVPERPVDSDDDRWED